MRHLKLAWPIVRFHGYPDVVIKNLLVIIVLEIMHVHKCHLCP